VDNLQHNLQFIDQLIITEPKHPITLQLEKIRAPQIRIMSFCMLAAINLYD
jgi:hypothetical protein